MQYSRTTRPLEASCAKCYLINPISSHTKEQIAAILFSDKEEIQLQFKLVQVQHGNADCGVFAVAFATALCSGRDPTEIQFIHHQLRAHLKKSLLENMITEFPQVQEKQKVEEFNSSRYADAINPR